MLKIISLFSVLLIVGHGAKIEDFYGNWYEAGFYPIAVYVPRCSLYSFSPAENQCTCDDGSNNSFYMSYTLGNPTKTYRDLVPVIIVDSPKEVMPAFSVKCRCGDRRFNDHPVARLVNENYFFLYHTVSENPYNNTEIDPSGAFLFSRKIEPQDTLTKALISTEDLKLRQGGFLCTTEYIEENHIDPKTII